MKAKVVIDNKDLLERGGFVNPVSALEFDGPGWYALSNAGEWVKVSSKSKAEGFTVEEAEREDWVGSPSYLGSFGEVEEWMRG